MPTPGHDRFTDDELRALLTATLTHLHGTLPPGTEARIDNALHTRAARAEDAGADRPSPVHGPA